MPETVEVTVYALDELGPEARGRAREWWREGALDHDWYDAVFEDFARIGEILGITFATRRVKLVGGGERHEPAMYFAGFGAQGDGASFEGTLRYARDGREKIRAYAPKEHALHDIADALHAIQRPNFYELVTTVTQSGHYAHEHTMTCETEREGAQRRSPTEGAEEAVAEQVRALGRWLYGALEREQAYQLCGTHADEMIRANGYRFTRNGEIFTHGG